jgi:hypothetical protein
MTPLYWIACVLAGLAAARAAVRVARNRSLAMAASGLCMTALSGALAIEGAFPDQTPTVRGVPLPSVADSSLGIVAAWALAMVLSAAAEDRDLTAESLVLPVLAGASGGGMLIGLRLAAHPAPPQIAIQLAILTYLCPALNRVAVLARRCSRRVPGGHVRVGMLAVSSAATADLGLSLARSSVMVARSAGVPVLPILLIPVAAAQAVTAIAAVGGATASAWVPPLVSQFRKARFWIAYRQLGPLWTTMRRAAPQAAPTAPAGTPTAIRYRLLRRVIEIRDGELALRPYWHADVANRASDAARSAGLSEERITAVREAAIIVSALAARLRGEFPDVTAALVLHIDGALGADLLDEAGRLVLVAEAIRHSGIVRQFGSLDSRPHGASSLPLPSGRAGRRWA